jgi:HAMP domain-containing protein/putative methionine-R-sulfoxide reductase with GAF domain
VVLLVVILTLIPGVVAALVLFFQARADFARLTTVQVTAVADLKRAQIRQWFELQRELVRELAADEDLRGQITAGAGPLTEVLADLATSRRQFTALLVIDPASGEVLGASGRHRSLIGQPFPDFDVLNPIGASPARYEPELDLTTLSILVAAPIGVSGEDPLGLLIALIHPSGLNDIVAPLPGFGSGAAAYVVTKDGDPLGRDLSRGQAPLTSDGIRQAVDGNDSAGTYLSPDGVEVIGAYRWLGDDIGLALLVEVTSASVFGPLTVSTSWVVLSLIVGLGLSLLAGVWAAGRLSRALQQLIDAAVRMAGGNLTVRVPVDRQDEIGQLSAAFNRLASDQGRVQHDLESQLALRRSQSQAVAAITRDLTTTRDLDTLLGQVSSLLQAEFGIDYVFVFIAEPDGSLRLRGGGGSIAQELRARGLRYSPEDQSVVATVAADGQPYLAPDVSEDNRYAAHSLLPDVRTELAIPLQLGERVIGVLDLQGRRVGAFTPADIIPLQIVANHLATGIAASRQVEIDQRSRRLDEALVALASQMHQTTNPARILETSARSLGRALGARRAEVRLSGGTRPPQEPAHDA